MYLYSNFIIFLQHMCLDNYDHCLNHSNLLNAFFISFFLITLLFKPKQHDISVTLAFGGIHRLQRGHLGTKEGFVAGGFAAGQPFPKLWGRGQRNKGKLNSISAGGCPKPPTRTQHPQELPLHCGSHSPAQQSTQSQSLCPPASESHLSQLPARHRSVTTASGALSTLRFLLRMGATPQQPTPSPAPSGTSLCAAELDSQKRCTLLKVTLVQSLSPLRKVPEDLSVAASPASPSSMGN